MTPFVPQIQERLARKNHTLGEFIGLRRQSQQRNLFTEDLKGRKDWDEATEPLQQEIPRGYQYSTTGLPTLCDLCDLLCKLFP